MTIQIDALYHPDFLGDRNQVRGVASALREQLREKGITAEIREVIIGDYQPIKDERPRIILTAGPRGLDAAIALKKQLPTQRVIWSGHQPVEVLGRSDLLPDIVALPEGTCPEPLMKQLQKKTVFLETSGVPHAVNAQTVAADVLSVGSLMPEDGQKVVGIILAGDAPSEDGMRFFDEADARRAAGLIASQLRDMSNIVVRITNGPRTGLHDSKTGETVEPNPHRTGAQDKVTRVFVEVLKEALGDNIDCHVHDFQFAKLPSAYKPILDAVRRSKGCLFCSSESTSMVTESQYVQKGGAEVVVYRVSSENPAHAAHLEAAHKQGYCQVLEEDGRMRPYRYSASASKPLAAERVANDVYQRFFQARRHLRAVSFGCLAVAGLFSVVHTCLRSSPLELS